MAAPELAASHRHLQHQSTVAISADTRDLWASLADDISVASSASDDGEHGFANIVEDEFGDFEEHLLDRWRSLEEDEPTDPYRVLGVKPIPGGDDLARIDLCFNSKLKACGPKETGVAGMLKRRLRRAHAHLHNHAKLVEFRHMGLRDSLILKQEWAHLGYKNGYYEGRVLRVIEPE